MSAECQTDAGAAAYVRDAGVPSRADLERVFFLDDEDRALIERRRGKRMKPGFSLQLVTVRWAGAFLAEPLDVPGVVLDFVAEQPGIADPSCEEVHRGPRPVRMPGPKDRRSPARPPRGSWRPAGSARPWPALPRRV